MLKYTDTILDCPDPMALAAFYAAVVGSEVTDSSDDMWATIPIPGGTPDFAQSFQRDENYTAPSWPEGPVPQQMHLDFEVDEFAPERERVIGLGATLVRSCIRDDGYGWEVFRDPVGHLFCLCRNKDHDWG